MKLDSFFFLLEHGPTKGVEAQVNCASCGKIIALKKEIDFLIFGTVGVRDGHENWTKKNNLSNVRFFPLLSQEKVPEVYSLADVSLVSCKKGMGGSAMPSKTWSILATGTPVLCSFDSGTELQRLVEDNELGLFSEAGDACALANNIMKLCNNQGLCYRYETNGRRFIENHLTKEVGTSRYVQVIKEVAEMRKYDKSTKC